MSQILALSSASTPAEPSNPVANGPPPLPPPITPAPPTRAHRTASQAARRCLHWLEQQGYTKLGILGTSMGSSVGYITLVHDERVRVGGFFHVSTYYADVISQGMTTNHVWEGLRNHVTADELREYWAPISPMPYVDRGMGAGRNCFMVYAQYDPTILPSLTPHMLTSLPLHG